MKTLLTLTALLLLLSASPLWAQNENFATAEISDVVIHEALTLQCLNHFDVEGITGMVAVFRIQHQGPANIDSEGIRVFVENELAGFCAQNDCTDVIQQAVFCGNLVTRILIP